MPRAAGGRPHPGSTATPRPPPSRTASSGRSSPNRADSSNATGRIIELAAADIASAPAARRQIADGNPNPPKPPRLRRDQHHSQHPRSSDVRHNRPPARPQPKATPPAWDTASAETTHGIAGPLALLALAARRGIQVEGQAGAIEMFMRWLDRFGTLLLDYPPPACLGHRHSAAANASRPGATGPLASLAVMQLAAIAVGDLARRQAAEDSAIAALTDPARLRLITDASLCHGWAGLLAVTRAIAADSPAPDRFAGPIGNLAPALPPASPRLRQARIHGRHGRSAAGAGRHQHDRLDPLPADRLTDLEPDAYRAGASTTNGPDRRPTSRRLMGRAGGTPPSPSPAAPESARRPRP